MLLHASLLRCSAAALALLTLGPGRGVDAWRIVYNEDTCFAEVTGEQQEAADPAAPLICYKYDGKAQGSNTCSMAGWGTTSFSSETCAAGEDVCFRRVKFFRLKKYWEHYGGCGAPDEDRPQDSEGYDLTNCTTSYCAWCLRCAALSATTAHTRIVCVKSRTLARAARAKETTTKTQVKVKVGATVHKAGDLVAAGGESRAPVLRRGHPSPLLPILPAHAAPCKRHTMGVRAPHIAQWLRRVANRFARLRAACSNGTNSRLDARKLLEPPSLLRELPLLRFTKQVVVLELRPRRSRLGNFCCLGLQCRELL